MKATHNPPIIPEEHLAAILQMHSEGLVPYAMAKQIEDGPTYTSITSWLKKQGITPHKNRKGARAATPEELLEREAKREEMLAVPCKTGCARCGDDFTGSLAEGKQWFRAHVCAVAA